VANKSKLDLLLKLDWLLVGSLILLAISVLGFAYLFWEAFAAR
jgi:hypothetical protein